MICSGHPSEGKKMACVFLGHQRGAFIKATSSFRNEFKCRTKDICFKIHNGVAL